MSHSPDRRWLPCDQCALPIETPIGGGTTACPRCKAPFAAHARPDTTVPRSPPTDEIQRRARLRLQDGKPLLPPPGFDQLVSGSDVPPHKLAEARAIWSSTRRHLLTQPGDLAAADRLAWLTMVLRNTYMGSQDEPMVRSLLEGSLEALMLPRHRQAARGHLARGAAREGDFASAEAWLAGCDPCSEDLSADTAYRMTRAFIDTSRSQYQDVLHVLGGNEDEVPIDDAMDPMATVFRANAWEKLGNLDAAGQVLTRYMARGGGAAVVENVVRAMPPRFAMCAQSIGAARTQAREATASRAASAGGAGMGWMVMIMGGGIPLVVLGVFVTSGQFELPMLFMLLFPVVFGGMGLRMILAGNRAKEIARSGVRGRGRIVSVSPTGTRINGVPLMRIELAVQIEGSPQVMASTKRLMSGGQQLVGKDVPVIWHPKYPADVVME